MRSRTFLLALCFSRIQPSVKEAICLTKGNCWNGGWTLSVVFLKSPWNNLAQSIILVHNHPAALKTFRARQKITERMVKIGREIGNYLSLRPCGFLQIWYFSFADDGISLSYEKEYIIILTCFSVVSCGSFFFNTLTLREKSEITIERSKAERERQFKLFRFNIESPLTRFTKREFKEVEFFFQSNQLTS